MIKADIYGQQLECLNAEYFLELTIGRAFRAIMFPSTTKKKTSTKTNTITTNMKISKLPWY